MTVPVRFDYVPPRKVYVTPGQSIRLRCSATGYPQPTITWSRGAEGLPKGAYFSNGTLTIKDISDVELGQYSCVVRNILGQKSYSLALAYRGIYMYIYIYSDESMHMRVKYIVCDTRPRLFFRLQFKSARALGTEREDLCKEF